MRLALAPLFQSHAVLQRDQPLPVWGWAPPLSRIRVTLGDHTVFCISNAQGDFVVRLPPQPAGGPHTLQVEVTESGEHIVLDDILIGEVWLASGQSNMEMTLAQSVPFTTDAIATADFPGIRYFSVGKRSHLGPHRTVSGTWQSATPALAGDFSAVGFSFARRLHRELGIPVGIINCSSGGTIIQTWTSRSGLALNPEISPWLAEYESKAWSAERWKDGEPDGSASQYPRDPGNTGLTADWHEPSCNDTDWAELTLPATWQSVGRKHSGVFWFRRTVEIPEAWLDRDLHLHLGAADKIDITYVNGIEVGRTGKNLEEQHWNVLRTYCVPAAFVTGRTLTIAVRVYSFVYDGGLIGPAAAMRLHPATQPEAACSLAGIWRHSCEHDLGLVVPSRVMGHNEQNSPHMLFDNMIQPLIPYALRGAIWYQGESNTKEACPYAGLLHGLILDWRRHWGLPDLAFHLVQLPGFQPAQEHQPDSLWARLREAQCDALSLPHVGIAVTIDLGEAGDIHPKNKMPVGERLAQSALALTYGHNLIAGGPLVEKFVSADGEIRCHFKHAGQGLGSRDGQPLRLFFIAGEDHVFHPAQTRIDGTTVVVSNPAVTRPIAVRYAWADNPEGCNLAGPTSLPASPFRSDR